VAIKPQPRLSPEVLEALQSTVPSLKAGARDHAASISVLTLGERVLEEFEAESARWAPSAEKLRRETVASILAGEAVDVQWASSVLRYPLEVTHVTMVA
jgi:hypothetical protein